MEHFTSHVCLCESIPIIGHIKEKRYFKYLIVSPDYTLAKKLPFHHLKCHSSKNDETYLLDVCINYLTCDTWAVISIYVNLWQNTLLNETIMIKTVVRKCSNLYK